MQEFRINGEQVVALTSVLNEQAARADFDGIGPVVFEKKGIGADLTVEFLHDGRMFAISGGGTVEEI